MLDKVKLLDCTLRDGGYYNNWNFHFPSVKKYLKQIYSSRIDVVEIGFNFFEKNPNYGQFAYADQKLIKKIPKNNKTKIAIMVNATDLLKIKGDYKKFLGKNFSNTKNLEIIRIATHLKDYKKIIKHLKYFKSINLKVFFNLMQINNVSKKKLKDCLDTLRKSNCVDVFYFADSFGNLKPNDVKKICNFIKKNWYKEIGIHSHDNCGLALKNSIQAFKSGATWVDGTIQGMGRGAGNVKTENLLKYFKKFNYNLKSIEQTSKYYFLYLKKKYKWGKSNYYKIAAKFNIHPTYIQMLQTDGRYSKREIINSINSLKKIVATSYDPLLLESSFLDNKNIQGEWRADNFLKNKNVLLIGQGFSLSFKKNLDKIEDFILKSKCTVISINLNKFIPDYLVDYFISSNERRILVDHQKYNNLSKPIIIPKNKLKKIKKDYQKINYLDYGVTVKSKRFIFKNNYAILPYNLTFAYAMAVALAGKAKEITLAGFDGYKKNQRENIEMQKTINMILKHNKSLKIKSLTKTGYKLN